MKLFSILSTTTMALLLAAGCSSTTTTQTDGGTETGTVADTGTGGTEGGTTDTGTATTDSGPTTVACKDCQAVKCASQMTACQEGATAAACVAQYNTWGNCVKACASADADQTACINKCNEAIKDPAATDLVTCVLDCASTCTQ